MLQPLRRLAFDLEGLLHDAETGKEVKAVSLSEPPVSVEVDIRELGPRSWNSYTKVTETDDPRYWSRMNETVQRAVDDLYSVAEVNGYVVGRERLSYVQSHVVVPVQFYLVK